MERWLSVTPRGEEHHVARIIRDGEAHDDPSPAIGDRSVAAVRLCGSRAGSGHIHTLKPGDWTPVALLVRAPWFSRVDLGVTKRVLLKGRLNFELRIDVLNVFDNANFMPVVQLAGAGGANIFQVMAAYRDPDNTFDPGGRIGQLGFRINW
jgi:hypothetical protein